MRQLATPEAGVDPRRRDLCVWLGTLASWRPGLVGRLVEEFGSVNKTLERPLAELRAYLRGRRVSRDASTQGAAERAVEIDRYAEVLDTSPAACVTAGAAAGRLEVAWSDALYPPSLRRLNDPPFCLFVAGRAADAELRARITMLCGSMAVAVVGTRGPSPYGAEMAALLGRDLALRGVVVVSGLALGVDALAQAAALRAAEGARLPTVAVLGCGPDVVYPRSHAGLYRRVLAEGLVVSEFAWGVPARPWRFPARNRVMAGLAQAVVVVEGTRRSGARITADFAIELGIDVLAVPGEAGRRLTQAPHALLRRGADVCESAEDVLNAIAGVKLDPELLAGDVGVETVARLLEVRSDDGRLAAVLRSLDGGEFSVDGVAAACGLRVPEAAALLSELEIEGLAAMSGPGTYRLRRV